MSSGAPAEPTIITLVPSSRACLTILDITAPNPNIISGMMTVGMTMVEMRVRRSRSWSFSSLRYTMRMAFQFIGKSGSAVEGGGDGGLAAHGLDEDFLHVRLGVTLAQLRQRALGDEATVVDDADDIA